MEITLLALPGGSRGADRRGMKSLEFRRLYPADTTMLFACSFEKFTNRDDLRQELFGELFYALSRRKRKQKYGAALVIERPILELLGASAETAFEVVTDGHALILTPIKDAVHSVKVRKSMDRIGKRYAKSFEELAK